MSTITLPFNIGDEVYYIDTKWEDGECPDCVNGTVTLKSGTTLDCPTCDGYGTTKISKLVARKSKIEEIRIYRNGHIEYKLERVIYPMDVFATIEEVAQEIKKRSN